MIQLGCCWFLAASLLVNRDLNVLLALGSSWMQSFFPLLFLSSEPDFPFAKDLCVASPDSFLACFAGLDSNDERDSEGEELPFCGADSPEEDPGIRKNRKKSIETPS